ncbi:MAG: dihydrofolate reductase [Campylobacteraceae bacterium]|jgi:dihydrofolate reductase|nr:dihydrofolate reductase [Campylobacteraceae bacterium]
MRLSIIVAVGKSWQIGLDNKLLWHIPEDLKLFKEITLGHHLIMGRKTYESIGKPLPNRTSIVLSKSDINIENAFTCKSLEEAIALCKKRSESEAFIIGGAQVYAQALPLADRLYLSTVDYNGKADVFFPPVIFRNWQVIEEKKYEKTTGKNGEIIPAWQHLVLQNLTHMK